MIDNGIETVAFGRTTHDAQQMSHVNPEFGYHSAVKQFFNGNILTMQRSGSRATSITVWRDRIVDISLRDNSPAESAVRVDLRGATVVPGLVDSHAHFMWWAFGLSEVDLIDCRSEEEAVDLVVAHAAKIPPGEWVVGRGWVHNFWEGAKLPSRDSLDRRISDRPVLLRSKCGHLIWVNSIALQIAGIDAGTPDPPGGVIDRVESNGQVSLTGVLKENAIPLVDSHIGVPSSVALEQALLHGQKLAHSFGLTCVHAPEGMDMWGFLQEAHSMGKLSMRIEFMPPVEVLERLLELKMHSGLGDDRLRLTSIKCFMDGSLGGRTAFMYEEHEGEPGNVGVCCTSEEEITRIALKANSAGWPLCVHAIGDRAVGAALRAFRAANAEMGRSGRSPLRNRIEHFQLISERDLALMREVQPVASMQPVHLCADMGPAETFWGSRSRFAYALRTLREAGCILTFGSDAPVESINPFYGMYAAITRQNMDGVPREGWYPEEKIGLFDALSAYTSGPATASGIQHRRGMLAEGMLADFVVLPKDPFQCSPAEIRDMRPLATYVGGRCEYASSDWQDAE